MLSADNGEPVAESYVGANRDRLLDPGVSPVLGDYRGLPPLLIQVGSEEILLDDARGVAARASEAGVPTELEVWPGMPHVFQAFAPMPESRRAIARIAAFIERRTTAREAPMLGLMQDAPLLISSLIRHADRHHGSVEIVSRRVEGDIHRYTWRDVHARAKRVANALGALGIRPGDRVATLAWNGYRHLELYFGVSGCGAVMHTINPRLAPDQVQWIAGHAEDRVLFFDITFLPVLEKVAPQCKQVKTFVLMADRDRMPASTAIPNLLCYEDLLAAASPDYRWPVFDENSASSICFTSGTTGNPKGVVYSHRSTMLHSMVIALPDSLHLSASETILPVVPMFHVNAWGIPYAAAMVGAKLVFPGPALDGKSLHDLMETERVTLSAGVPTVWQGLLAYMEQNGLRFTTMRRTIIGGSALPPAMLRAFEERFDVDARHAWGMTEMSPVGTVCATRVKHRDASPDELFAVKSKQGRAVFGVDMKIVDPEGHDLPWDGKACGDLQVRGPWIVREYLRGDGGDPLVRDADGLEWFPTGDVACIDADGYMQITDRSKDVIKSGGEWISSIDIENIALTHPCVAMAACIGVRHPKWDERPLLVVVRKPGAAVECAELLRHYEGKVAKWQVPDDVVFVDAIPLGATGKMQKNKLRDQFRDHLAGTGT
jgi:fatty-acyl-CoA synthase